MQFDQETEQRLRSLVDVFLAENAKLNLSAFRTQDACWNGNVLDSLSFLEILPALGDVRSVMDVGTGGGFPLLPLAICLPQTTFVGMDATIKKVDAVNRIIASLQLPNVRCVVGRAEELGRSPTHREQYDVVTARAVAELPVLLEYCSPFVQSGGHVVLWKSVTVEEELRQSLLARAEFSTHLIAQHQYALPGNWGKRQLLTFRKDAALSGKYPRDVGLPKKKPLV